MTNSIAKKIFASAVAVSSAFMGFAPIAAQAVSAGEVYKTTDGTVWFITSDMQRRPFSSGGAFLSYGFLSWAQVKDATAEVSALTEGSIIPPQDGKIFCATATKGSDVNGECSLITGGMKAAFTSSAVFSGLGYSFSRAQYGDSSFLTKTANLDNAGAAHSAGVLVNIDGTVYLVGSSSLMGIPSVSVFESWGYSFADVVTANSADRSMTKSGIMASRTPGHLSPSTSSSDDEDNDGPLTGGAGDVTITLNSTYSAEDVGEGEDDVSVLSFDVEADDDSDVEVTSVKIEVQQTVTTNSEDITDYLTDVKVWMDGDEVGSADVEDFTESSDRYSKSISLDGAIVRAGETAEFVVSVSALDNLDSADIDNDAWDVELDSLRFVDGEGVTTTETPAADAIDQSFDIDSFASAGDVELDVSLTDDAEDIYEAHVIDVDDTNDTDNVSILALTLEAGEDSDVNVSEIPVLVTVTGAANVDDMITGIGLWMGDDELATDTVGSAVGATETYTFEDLDIDVEAGEMVDLEVKVNLKSTADVDLDNGDTIMADLTGTEVDLIEAEDETGEDLSTDDLTGTADGEAHAVYDAGISVEFVSADAERTFTGDAAGEDDQGSYEIVFDITAFDGDMYIDDDCEDDNGAEVAGQGTVFDVNAVGGTPTGGGTCLVDAAGTITGDHAASWRIPEGDTRRFTFTVTLTADTTPTDGSYQVVIESINWDNEAGGVDGSPDFFYNFNMDEYETSYLFLNAQ